MQQLDDIVSEAEKAIEDSSDLQSLEQLRVNYLGKKGRITEFLKNLGQMSAQERPKAGQAANAAKQSIQSILQSRIDTLKSSELQAKLTSETIDITLPGRGDAVGSLHPVTQTRQRIESFFEKLGFESAEGPEIEDDYHNFEALNIPDHHPARAMHDTFYTVGDLLLRTHTSPVQIRTMKNRKPPIRIIACGRAYRCDSDVTHTPMFHQIEGLMVGENVSFTHLKGVLIDFVNYIFAKELKTRFRPSYFPFTEPSAEMDIECTNCNAKGCRVCSHTGWLEILGCGMVHPQVLKNVDIDPEKYTGWAFGSGIDRIAMLLHKIDDLRLLFENDIRFLKQF